MQTLLDETPIADTWAPPPSRRPQDPEVRIDYLNQLIQRPGVTIMTIAENLLTNGGQDLALVQIQAHIQAVGLVQAMSGGSAVGSTKDIRGHGSKDTAAPTPPTGHHRAAIRTNSPSQGREVLSSFVASPAKDRGLGSKDTATATPLPQSQWSLVRTGVWFDLGLRTDEPVLILRDWN